MQQSQASNRDALTAFKRPRAVGHGIFVSKSGYTCIEAISSLVASFEVAG